MKKQFLILILQNFLEHQEVLLRLLKENEGQIIIDQKFWQTFTEKLYLRRQFLAQIKGYRIEEEDLAEREKLKLLIRKVIIKDLELRKHLLDLRERLAAHLRGLHDKGEALKAYGKNATSFLENG